MGRLEALVKRSWCSFALDRGPLLGDFTHPSLPLPAWLPGRVAQDSELLSSNRRAVDAACQPEGEPPSVSGGTYAATYWQQLRALLGRQAVRYWRLPQVGRWSGASSSSNCIRLPLI